MTTNITTQGVEPERIRVSLRQFRTGTFGILQITTGDLAVSFYADGESAAEDLRSALITQLHSAEVGQL